jgi:hypothetical protein
LPDAQVNVTSFLTTYYDDFPALRLWKNEAKRTEFDETPDHGLSSLRKQESRLFNGLGFRIKCGMTALEAPLTEHDLKKQSQFPW